MALFGTGGFDKRQARRERQALPICDNCPNIGLREALQAGRASRSQIERKACGLAEQLLRQAGCESPEELSVSSSNDDFSVPMRTEQVCVNPNAAAAEAVIEDTRAAVSAERL